MRSILFILSTPWSDKLGVSRVSIRISEHLDALGWHCDHVCFDQPYFNVSVLDRAFNLFFIQRQVLKYIKKYGFKYDAIQVEHNLIRYPRSKYKYSGKLIAKSNGLVPIYHEYLKRYKILYPIKFHHKIIQKINNLSSGGYKVILNGFNESDQIHVNNEYELNYVSKIGFADKSHVIVDGLSDIESNSLLSLYSVQRKFYSKLIVTIGTWSTRKGSNEWPHLVRALRSADPNFHFRFLGTSESPTSVISNFFDEDKDFIEVIPNFEVVDLPELLKDAKLGVFMSYVEGFGIGLLEMLASGTPVVTWDVPGPKEMYRHGLRDLITAPGNVLHTKQSILYFNQLQFNGYRKISLEAINISKKFNWRDIANKLDKIL